MSISVTSGRCERNFSTASLPFDASATSFMSGSAVTSVAIPSRSRGWSSTVRTRINLGSTLMASPFGARRIQRRHAFCKRSRRKPLSELLFQLPLRSRNPIALQFVAHVHGCRLIPSARRARHGLSRRVPFLFRRHVRARETHVHRSGSQPRSHVLEHAETHCVTIRELSGQLPPPRSETMPVGLPLRSHGNRAKRQPLVLP